MLKIAHAIQIKDFYCLTRDDIAKDQSLDIKNIESASECELRKKLEIIEEIGHGRVSCVFLGRFKEEDVVIKRINKAKDIEGEVNVY